MVDVVLIGAGIMSATLGTLLHALEPDWSIVVLERMDRAAAESSDAWNNAGTGHSAYCELNYTPEVGGRVRVDKAVEVAAAFEVSRQLWSTLVERGAHGASRSFVRSIPHCSFVRGVDDGDLLRRRFAALSALPLFDGMEISSDPREVAAWMPLVMEGRDPRERVTATRVAAGTDVDFGALTRAMFRALVDDGVDLRFFREVTGLDRRAGGGWRVGTRDPDLDERDVVDARFVFVGAGGGALPLLLASGIREGQRYGGFPVSGQFLVCREPGVVARHHAKVYGQAAVGAPPMSVPHLDTRFIDGAQTLLFGPFAGFSTRFLKNGSLLDLPMAIRSRNVLPMLAAGLDNLALTRYLVEQVVQTHEERCDTLRGFVPTARPEEWELLTAGQRVQVIQHDDAQGGVLQFGTHVVAAGDGSLAALLGASPGASTAASIQLDVLKRCFPDRWEGWRPGLKALIPCLGDALDRDPVALRRARARSASILGLVG